ncbi:MULTISPECIES: hypothetical protein [unclassified Pseudomonas]|uniref:hypothetical protein n=1 Tax=unclassified Pseudomonas TaxID=196821 RepID=UPI000A1F2412|nr:MULTISPECIES: hypothetical protein [unclassified Pseudomonas]
MRFTSENETVNQHHIGYRSLGFGEPTDLKTKQYELIIELNKLPSSFIEHANTFIQQCRLDDTEQGFSDIQELQTLQYPEFYELTKKSPTLSASLIKDYLYFDLLFALFPQTENLKLVISNITSIQVSDTRLKITGETFPFK